MSTLTPLDKARKIYPNSAESVQNALDAIFGKETFKPITERVKSYEDACKVLGGSTTQVDSMGLTLDELAYVKLKKIIEALNEGWKPDWNDDDQPKFYPWFRLDGDFRFYDASYCYTCSTVGSRLCFRSRELCIYAATQFLELYKVLFTK